MEVRVSSSLRPYQLKSAATEIWYAPAPSAASSKMGVPPAPVTEPLPLHTLKLDPRVIPNRAHALLYTCAIFALLYHHFLRLLHSPTFSSFSLFFAMLLSDIILAFMWATTQSFRWRPVCRQTCPENLPSVVGEEDFPGLDVFICTADPYKEPPMSVVNTALSAMAFDYPTGKISVYVSDDGGSDLTLFAFMEAARFARHWLPFCRENKVEDRCPEMYFKAGGDSPALKEMYHDMKERVERMVEGGQVRKDEIRSEDEANALKNWTDGFTRQDHPTVIQVLLESEKDVDVRGTKMPNFVYVSREKCKSVPHNFKAGALNVLIRVSGAMSNSPLILTLDCDMYSNDPRTLQQALCYLIEPLDNQSSSSSSNIAFVQFPQRFQGINKHDIYACEHKRLYQINPAGMDGLAGPAYVGSGCFFRRQAFYGPPPPFVFKEAYTNGGPAERPPIGSSSVLDLAHEVASCTYELGTSWGVKMGLRYGSLSEDLHTGYWMHMEGWSTVFSDPSRPAFLGDTPITLSDALNQNKRWCIGQLEVGFCKHNPVTFGTTQMSPLMSFTYAYYAYWALWALPIMSYGLLPQLGLLHNMPLFPKLSDPWFYCYTYLFLGAYGQDLLDFLMAKGTIQRWWSDQRMWMMRGVSSFLFALLQFSLTRFGVFAFGFNVTSKVVDGDQNKRYEEGMFEFGVHSPLFVPPATIALINLVSFAVGLYRALLHVGVLEEMLVQLFISGWVVVNGWPIYEAMVVRRDRGKMHMKTTLVAVFLAVVFCIL